MNEGAAPPGSISVSVVLPIHNECQNLAPLIAEIAGALSERVFEIVAVDDGSDDGSLPELRRLQAHYPILSVVSLRQRSGQSAAIIAGCERSRGTLVATLDADGQNDPGDLALLFRVLEEHPGAAVVGYRTRRGVGWSKRVQSTVANFVRNRVTGDRVRDTGCSLRLVPRSVMLCLPRFDGMHRFLATLVRHSGTPVHEVPVGDRPRRHGSSHYGLWNRIFRGWRDAWGVHWLLHRPLRYTVRGEEME